MIVRFSRDTNPPRRILPAGSQHPVQDTDADGTAGINELCDLHLGWIYLTHVCHLFRNITLDCSDLWTLIDTNVLPKDWCLEMIARSKNYPISFSRDWNMATFGLEELSPVHLLKTKKIEVSQFKSHAFHPTDPQFNTFLTSLYHAAPVLEEFYFHTSMYEEILQRRYLSLPGTLFVSPEGQYTTSKLRTVSLFNVIPPLNALFLTNLTSLSISFNDGYPDEPPRDRCALPTAQLMTALQRMPLLEVLVLRNCLPSDWSPSDRGTALQLARLKKIELVTRNPLGLASLLSTCCVPAVMAPGGCVLRARFSVTPAPIHCEVVLSVLKMIFGPGSSSRSVFVHEQRGFETLALTLNGGRGSGGRTSRSLNSVQPCLRVEASSRFNDCQDSPKKTIDLMIPGPQPIDRQTSSLYICQAAFRILPSPLLKNLTITYDWGLDPRRPWTMMNTEEVRELLKRFPNLEKISCGEEMAGPLISLLSDGRSTSVGVMNLFRSQDMDVDREGPQNEDVTDDTTSTPFLPSLRSIRFLNIEFGNSSPLVDALTRMLELRGECGTPIRHVALTGCECDDWRKLRQKLRMMVPRVDIIPKSV